MIYITYMFIIKEIIFKNEYLQTENDFNSRNIGNHVISPVLIPQLLLE